jgi:hypothetical protein
MDEEYQYAFFRDSASAHTARASVDALRKVFEDRIIISGLWPAYSCDLNLCFFYLWGMIKQKVY